MVLLTLTAYNSTTVPPRHTHTHTQSKVKTPTGNHQSNATDRLLLW